MRNDGKMSEYRKTDDALISVIVPVYKVEQYLEKCVNSISVQTYSNLEIILVDDGSPDKCGDICDSLAKKDKSTICPMDMEVAWC